jgi:6-phosphogluconate dehydrogenase
MENFSVEDVILKAKEKAKEAKRKKVRVYIRITLFAIFLVSVCGMIQMMHAAEPTNINFKSELLKALLVAAGLLGSLFFQVFQEDWSFPVKVKDDEYKEYIPQILAEKQNKLDEIIEDAEISLTDWQDRLNEAREELEEAQALRIEFEGLRYDPRLTSL